MSMLHATFHCHGPSESERGTAVGVEQLADCVTVRLGRGGELPQLTIFVTRPAEAFALAQAFASAGEILERRAAVSRRNEVAAEPWADVPLPLDEPELCECGKPAAHVLADPDSQEWGCLVPLPEDQAQREAARPPYAVIDLAGRPDDHDAAPADRT